MYCATISGTSRVESGFTGVASERIHVFSGWKAPNLPVIGYLRDGGFSVKQIIGWREAASPILNTEPDMVVLDFDLTEPESLTALIKMRQAFHGPLVVLSDRADEIFHILALDLGADDFIGGQVSSTLLASRIKALIRRFANGRKGPGPAVSLGSLVIDAGRREVFLRGRLISFTSVEFDLLLYLGRNAGTVVSRNDLYRAILNREYNGMNRTVDMYISRLRKKLGDDLAPPRMLKSVRGTGYLMSRQVP